MFRSRQVSQPLPRKDHQTCVYRDYVVAAETAEGSVFDHTQQFGLRFDAESRDFV